MRRRIRALQYYLIVLIAGALALLFVLPVFVTFTNSFMTAYEIRNRYAREVLPSNLFYTLEVMPQIHFVRMTIIPAWVTIRQYLALIRDARVMNSFWNSVIITGPAVVGQLIVCVPAAFAFEFMKWRHKEKLFFMYIVIMLMPLPVILVPQFVMARQLGISESMLAVILPAVFGPFGVFLLRQFLKTMPLEVIEAAKIDGAGYLRILVHMVVPLTKAAIAALALLVFIDYWNVVDQAIVFITDAERWPLSVYLSLLVGNFDIIFAASVFYMLPALLVFLHGQEYLIEGMKMSGLK